MDNNKCILEGKIISECEFSHETYEEKFFKFTLEVIRFSKKTDKITAIVSERSINISDLKVGTFVSIEGSYRSYNKLVGNRNKLVLNVFVKNIDIIEDCNNINEISLEGFICKKPNYRETPLGRHICDSLIAVNRGYKKSDYIPCIIWGRNAKYVSSLSIGDKIKLKGRIQSREYQKEINGKIISNLAFEISVANITVI